MQRLAKILILGALIGSMPGGALAQTEPPPAETNLVPRLLEAFTQLQSQHVATVQALGEARLAAATASHEAAQQLDDRVQQLEASLRRQHTSEVAALREAQRSTLQAVGVVALLALFVVVCLALLFLRHNARRPEASPVTTLAPLPNADLAPVTPGTNRLLTAVDDLERRLAELETTALTPQLPATAVVADPHTRAALLLGKGQSLLALKQAAEALACFQEAAELDPTNPEVYIRQGIAREKLDQFEEAIAAYDQAIARDETQTMAYLRKGGVFNRLERHPDALACYEQALRTHDNARPA
jgi:tetratricopeptide (TPR) repeat protein